MNYKTLKKQQWVEGVIKEFLDAPTTRQAIDEIGNAIFKMIEHTITEGGFPEEYPHEYIQKMQTNMEAVAGTRDFSAEDQKLIGDTLRFWRAVDKIAEITCCQLLMTDEMVEEEVRSEEIMGFFKGKTMCHHKALILILIKVHSHMIETVKIMKKLKGA